MPSYRYYAIINDTANLSQDVPIIGWNAIADGQDASVPPCPVASGTIAVALPFMTDATWADRPLVNPVLRNKSSVITGPTPTHAPPPLREQAQAALQTVQQQASMVSAMGETFGPQMRDYVKALRAIISGSDTTSTALPTAPNDPTT